MSLVDLFLLSRRDCQTGRSGLGSITCNGSNHNPTDWIVLSEAEPPELNL
jgi:hypothetical protein